MSDNSCGMGQAFMDKFKQNALNADEYPLELLGVDKEVIFNLRQISERRKIELRPLAVMCIKRGLELLTGGDKKY